MDNAPATDPSMQDIAARLVSALDAEDETRTAGPTTEDDEVINDDNLPAEDDNLPDDDDSESEDEEKEADLEEIAEDATLADFLGVDENRITVDEETGEVALVSKIDGEDKLVPLKELVSSYQLQGHVNNKSIALENERKEFDDTKRQVAEELKTRIKGTMALSKVLEDELVNEYNSIDWDTLRATDAANWTALRQEYAEKAQRIQKAQQLAQEQMGQIGEKQQAEMAQKFQEHVVREKQKVVEANPDWADENVFKSKIDEINSFLKTQYRFDDDELKALNDHRLLAVIQDAKKYREGAKGAETKRLKKVPKFLKPGQQRGNRASLEKARRVKAQKSKVKSGGGSVRDVASLIEDRM